MEDRLRIFAKWLSNYYDSSYDPCTEGALEALIRKAQDGTTNKIGALLIEVLDFTDEQVKAEVDDN
jgi:hypothetical protein